MSDSALDRERKAHQDHIRAIQAEKTRQAALLSVPMRERIAKWGPSLEDLMLAIDAAIEASDPTRGQPMADTARVSVPSKNRSPDEGASTRRMREKMRGYQKDVYDLAARMAMTFGQELPDRRDYSAHVRWHVNRERAADGCLYCLKEAS